jgi:DNA-binding response OmpR family regulator/signal transduction histidine kinase
MMSAPGRIFLKKKTVNVWAASLLLGFLAGTMFLYSGQRSELTGAGITYFQNFSRKDYDGQPQNWCIARDKRGIVYSANQGAVLEFDGVSWREITIPNKTARSLATDEKGTVYVGGINEIGFLTPGPGGSLEYQSLVKHLEKKHRRFGYVWRILSTKEGIFFWTSKFLLRWNLIKMQVWETDTFFDTAYVCSGKLYVRQRGKGLFEIKGEIKGNNLEPLPGTSRFVDEKIYTIAPYDSRRLLIGTNQGGLFIYDGKKTVPFPTEADDYLKKNGLYHGIRLSPSRKEFALATRRGGLVIIDSQGSVKALYNKSSGLLNDNVKFVYQDSGGTLWLALENGMAKIEYLSPFSIYDRRSGLPGQVRSVTRHGSHNLLYAGTGEGLYVSRSGSRFLPDNRLSTPCWSLLSTGVSLLAATENGVYRLTGTGKNEIIKKKSFVLSRSRKDKNRIWAGTLQGLVSLYLTGRQWREEYSFKETKAEIRSIVEDKQGNLWLGTRLKGVFKLVPAYGRLNADPVVKQYDTTHGLPPGEVHIFWAAGRVIVGTGKGIFRFDEKKQSFMPDTALGGEFAGGENGKSVFRLTQDSNKNIWFHSNGRNFKAAPRLKGTCIIERKKFLRIRLARVETIYPDPDGRYTWFAGTDGLIRYDSHVEKDCDTAFQTFIRKVWIDGQLVFNGYKSPGAVVPVIPFRKRNLRFGFAAPFFEAGSETLYQCFLEGYSRHWTAWSKETRKDYTNIEPGLNIFRVRAKNIYGNVSHEAAFQFRVLYPWYRSWWAYLAYILLFLLLLYASGKWRSLKHEKEKQQLEGIIELRTKEINRKNEQLLEMANIKTRFFANISHEFRTPLTLIMGPLEHILSQNPDKEMTVKANLMMRNSRRLLNLVDQLLALAKADSGKLKLAASPQNIVALVKSIAMCFESLAQQKNIELRFHEVEENIPVYVDPEKLEKIISNLMSNAFNYTPEGGKVTVSIQPVTQAVGFDHGCVEISVRDTGSCIPAHQLPHIFDRFFQAEGSDTRQGTGIGLALVKELVEIHQGKIEAHSICSEDQTRGSKFTVYLPMGKEHLKPEEMAGAEVRQWHPPPPKPIEQEPVDQHPAAEAKTGAQKEKPLVLVVDDNADVRTHLQNCLTPGFNVVEAADGKAGIMEAKSIIPDLILCDVMMPGTDGYEVCRILKADILTSHIPIILLTAKAGRESELEGLETGADDYIAKPFSSAVLLVRINNLIQLRRQMQLEQTSRMALRPDTIRVSAIDDKFYNTLRETIDLHIKDPDFNVEALTRHLNMSQASLYRKVHALTGHSPTDFIRFYRVKRGAQLLLAGAGKVSVVARNVGFSNTSYFRKCFKAQFHCSPADIATASANSTNGSDPGTIPCVSPAPGQEVVLVVEDNEDTRHYIRESLEPYYRVVESENGSQAIARAMEIIPDLMVSDIMVPGTDGYELCAILKKDIRTSHIPIVLLTAKASEQSIIRGLETGADDYIIKPFNTEILQARIKNLIGLRAHLQDKRKRELELLPTKTSPSKIDRGFLEEVNAQIEKNLSEPEFKVKQLAEKLYIGSATLYRKMQALTGEVPSSYIRSYRLRKAAELLAGGAGSVTEVAFEVGFTSRAYFSLCFKEKFHRLPSTFKDVSSP